MGKTVVFGIFEWDEEKDRRNIKKHNVDFTLAMLAFGDYERLIISDDKHSQDEVRFSCYGRVYGQVLTVHFTLRELNVRIIGAGYWRLGRKRYEKEKSKKDE